MTEKFGTIYVSLLAALNYAFLKYILHFSCKIERMEDDSILNKFPYLHIKTFLAVAIGQYLLLTCYSHLCAI